MNALGNNPIALEQAGVVVFTIILAVIIAIVMFVTRNKK